MSERVYELTKSGMPIDDKMIQDMAEEAERGYDPASSGSSQAAVAGPPR
jgi:hypothetical protein